MTPLLLYWLKANLFLCLFFGCYWLLLRNHTFLRLNRVYLLGTLLASYLLPLVQIPGLSLGWLWDDETPVTATVTAEGGYVVSATELPVSTPMLPDWPELLYWAALAGAFVLLMRAGWRVGRVLWRIHQWPTAPQPDHTLVYPPDSQTPTFSFFRYLVLNPADTQSETVRQHELGHIRQWHSVDVLLIELAQALCWPNPALWGYGRALRETHEFLADRFATEQATTQRDDYARFLVSYAFDVPADALTHPFSTNQTNFPSLKQRIQMIYKQHTQRRALWKYALILPVATALLALTTAPEPTSDPVNNKPATPGSTKQVYIEGVISGTGHNPLPGAFVSVKGANSGATTDQKGHFQLTVPSSTILAINARGYHDLELPIKPEDGDYVVFSELRLTPKTSHAPKSASEATAPSTTSVRVSGVVRASDNSPLPGATIEVKNGQRGTTTDVEGHFQLDAPAGSTLITRFVGFKPQAIAVAANISVLNVNVVLNPASATANVPKPAVEPYRVVPSQQDKVFTVVQQVPMFPGGQVKMYRFLGQTLRYPAEAVKKKVSGKVFVSFVVNANGHLDQIRVLKGIGAGCDEEAVRVISLMPNWIPGKQNGRVVAVKYNLPINFQLDKKPVNATGFNQSDASATPDAQTQLAAIAKPAMTAKPLLRTLMGQEPLYVINGEEITKAEMEAIDPATIEAINVWKSGPKLDAYGSKAQYGLVEITLKAK